MSNYFRRFSVGYNHLFPQFNDSWADLPSNLGYGWVITSRNLMWMCLLNHGINYMLASLISINKWSPRWGLHTQGQKYQAQMFSWLVAQTTKQSVHSGVLSHVLTHWDRKEMAAILQTFLLNVVSLQISSKFAPEGPIVPRVSSTGLCCCDWSCLMP